MHQIINQVDLWSLARLHAEIKKDLSEIQEYHGQRMIRLAKTRRELQNIKNILTNIRREK
jgi:hypothetical protein